MQSIANLIKNLSDNFEQMAFESGAIKRLRGFDRPADLMILLLFHLHSGCSLLEISQVAYLSKIAKLSDVAFMKRLSKCSLWFCSINEALKKNAMVNFTKPEWLLDYD